MACDILRDHPDLLDIIRNLELKSLCDRHKAAHLPAHKTRNREQLLQSVNVLVSSGKLVAAEELLEEELAENEDPELLDLLGRVYILINKMIPTDKKIGPKNKPEVARIDTASDENSISCIFWGCGEDRLADL